MDFLDPKKKRAHTIRLFVGYALMGVALLIATAILVLEASGYDVDRKTGTVIQNGLVFIDAAPEEADIFLNGDDKGRTDNRLVMPAGDYNLTLKQAGYRDWTHDFSLVGSTIERFIYPVLFPVELKSRDLQLFAAQPGLSTESPDRKWLIVQRPGSVNDFLQFTLDNETDRTTTFTVPAEVISLQPGATNTLTAVEWSSDNRRVILKHTFDGGSQFILLDRENPAESVNLTKVFTSTPFNDVRLRDKKFDQLYLYNQADGSLQTADLKTRLSAPYLSLVGSFQPYGDDMLMYTTTEGAPVGKVLVRLRDGSQNYLIRELPVSPDYVLDFAKFDNRWYFGIGASVENKVYIYKDGFKDLEQTPSVQPKPSLLLNVPAPKHISFSANARFIAVQGGSSFGVYDAENNRIFNYDTKLPQADTQKATWMDGHRITLVSDNKLVIFDFDNTNRQTLVTMSQGTRPFFNRDYTALYTISPSTITPDKPALIRTELKINK